VLYRKAVIFTPEHPYLIAFVADRGINGIIFSSAVQAHILTASVAGEKIIYAMLLLAMRAFFVLV
jgi:hypothetical protein